MGHVFISYSHKDIEYVEKLDKILRSKNIDVWRDKNEISYGDDWVIKAAEALDSCAAFIIIMSEHSYKSDNVQDELRRAKRLNKKIFPLYLSGDIWLQLERPLYADVQDGSLPDDDFYIVLDKVITTEPQNKDAETEAQLEALKPTSFPWRIYFRNLANVKKIKDSVKIKPYIDLYTTTRQYLSESVENFLNDDRDRILKIEGDALSGKTSFMARFIADIAKNNIIGEDTMLPTSWIPVYFPLNRQNITNLSELRHHLKIKCVYDKAGRVQESTLELPDLFRVEALQWLIFIDGLDEIAQLENRDLLLEAIYEFMYLYSQYSRIKIVLTSRPWVGLHDNKEYTKGITVAQLTWEQIENHLVQRIDTSIFTVKNMVDILKPIKKLLEDEEPELKKICSLPGYLSEFHTELPLSELTDESSEDEQENDEDEQEEGNPTSEADIALVKKITKQSDIDSLSQTSPEEQFHVNIYINKNLPERYVFKLRNYAKQEYFFLPIVKLADKKIITLSTDKNIKLKEKQNHDADNEKILTIEEIRTGLILSGMYSKIWNRELERYGKSQKGLRQKTRELATHIDGRQYPFSIEEAQDVMKNENQINWLLNLGILKEVEHDYYQFYQPITAVFFAMEYMKPLYRNEASEKTRKKLETYEAKFKDGFRKRVEKMFESAEGFPPKKSYKKRKQTSIFR